MSKILIIFAHPLLEKSRIHNELLHYARKVPEVLIHDLYERYPEFDINVEKEKRLLSAHDVIIWQHPFYWYSAPAILKQWQDVVLEHGWAYGREGHALKGKKIFNVLTTGASVDSYQVGGFNKYPIQEFLKPYERTAELCHMTYWPPYWVHSVHKMTKEEAQKFGMQYEQLLKAIIANKWSDSEVVQKQLLNDFF
jgi:glutathione-regulated potassium-efflux system ancillary protein KefG